MAKVYINGEQVTGCTNYASAVTCVDKDGNQSTVQSEVDKLNNSVDEVNKGINVQITPTEITRGLDAQMKIVNKVCMLSMYCEPTSSESGTWIDIATFDSKYAPQNGVFTVGMIGYTTDTQVMVRSDGIIQARRGSVLSGGALRFTVSWVIT